MVEGASGGQGALDDIAKCSIFVLMDDADPRSAMLADMGACAYRLGMAFGAEAERAQTTADRLQYFQLFDRCFFAVRVGIALDLRLEREARRAGTSLVREGRADLTDRAERDPPEDEPAEPLEREPPETLEYTERDREREAEGASLPLLLRTLEGVAADAAALPGPPPAALPTLQDLLARFSSDPVPAPGPGGGQPLRARLSGSAAALAARPAPGQTVTLSPSRPPSAPPMARGGPRLRGATGPPRA
jgi:hypothetical protein